MLNLSSSNHQNLGKPFNTKQILTSLFITQNGDIFIGTNYWLLFYHFPHNFKEKNHYLIGSKINHIDIKSNEGGFNVALATFDGYIHFLQIDDYAQVKNHFRTLIFNEESQFVSVANENTIVSAGDDSFLSIISIQDHSKIKECIQKPNKITALKVINEKIYVGYQNGLIEIMDLDFNVSKTINLKSPVIKIDGNATELIFMTTSCYYKYENDLKTVKESKKFDNQISKAAIHYDHIENTEQFHLFITDGKNGHVYENGDELKSFDMPKDCVNAAFVGDYLFTIFSDSGVMIPLCESNALDELNAIEEEESDVDFI